MKFKALIIPIVLFLIAFFNSVYIIDETEQVIVTRLGKVIGEPKTEPGLKIKWPFFEKANYFPKTLLEWDGKSDEIPTKDKKFIFVDTFARWKIVDPLRFYKTVINENRALGRLDDILDSVVRNYITSYPLIEAVRSSNRALNIFEENIDQIGDKRALSKIELGRDKIVQGIMEQAQPKLADFGILLVDVKIKRLNYVEEVRKSVYDRMIAERKQIAEKFRSEGIGEAYKIEGKREKELKRITSEAYKKAQEIIGRADAEATMIYAKAFGRDPDFYSFIQTLDIYKESLDKDSSLILSTDSEFLKYFKGYKSMKQD
ncbi:MAG: protease modulator HflC [Thermodesulfobacteriota bacterium]|nr:protease modulator HflC [Thermodesulfobacteriota bacterium]